MVRWLTVLALLIACTACNSTSTELAPAGLDVAQQLADLAALPAPEGVDPADWQQLKGALATYIVRAYPGGKIPAATTTSILAATELTVNAGNDGLQWRFASPGDYDQNGEVNISDLSPLGAHLGEASGGGSFPFATAQSVIDGDSNGEINISDITPIGANIGRQVLQYNVFCSPSDADYPASNGEANKVDPVGSIAIGAAAGNRTSDRLQFEFDLTIDSSAFYWVRPSDGTDNGTPSNIIGPQFAAFTLDVGTGVVVGEFSSLALIDGNPAIGYYDRDEGRLMYIRSSTATGAAPEDWGPPVVVFDPPGHDVGQYLSLAEINGAPAMSYWDATFDDLEYAFSSTADGVGPWTAVTVDTEICGQHTALALVDGKPAISYRDAGNTSLKYAHSSEANGASGWSVVTVDTPAFAQYTSLAVVDGKPAISFYDTGLGKLKYAFSSQVDGSSGWTALEVNGTGNIGVGSSLAVVDGKPAISSYDAQIGGLLYSRSSQVDGSSGWTTLTVDFGLVGEYSSLTVINGKPAISYYAADGSDLRYATSTEADGGSGWTFNTVDSGGAVGTYSSLAALGDGGPAISYHDLTNGDLKFAILR